MKKKKENKIITAALFFLRRACWKEKFFVGSYWETNDRIKEWIKNSPVIVLRLKRDKTTFVDFDTNNKEEMKMVRSVRIKNKEAEKQRSVHVVYVQDNAYTRMLGYKETIDHLRLLM